MKRSSSLSALAVGLTLLAPAIGHADTVNAYYTGTNKGGGQSVTTPLTSSPWMGNYWIKETTGPAAGHSFLAYCIDPFQWVATSTMAHEKSALSLSSFSTDPASRYANVVELYSHAYQASTADNAKAAAFQWALWEVFNDDGNLDTGSILKTGSTNPTLYTNTKNLLDSLASHTWSTSAQAYTLTTYVNSAKQDFLTAIPVPEPESYALMLAGLGLLGLVARRRMK